MSHLRLLLSGSAIAAVASCTAILGDDFTIGGGGPGGSTSASSSTMTGMQGGGGSTSTMTTTVGGSGPGGSGGGGGPATGYDCGPQVGAPPALVLTEVASGLSGALLAKSPPEDPTRLFIVQQNGRVQVLHNGSLSLFLDLAPVVQNQGERGLLGLAFHPDYAQNRRFFVHYSAASDGDTTLAEYLTDANDPNVADPGSANVFLSVAQPYANHNGGSIEFSPMDGFLYIGLGDGGSGNDPMDNAQNMSSYLGKMLRIDIDPTPFTNPPGNLSGPIWDLGLRNPYRFSFDACTGDLYIGDVGQNQYEEVNVEPAGEGGKNYGWRDMEGMHCNGAIDPNCSMAGFTLPVLEYTHGQGCSISGGYVYRGSKIPGLRGAYLYGDYCSGRVWFTRYDVATRTVTTPVELTGDLGSDSYAISSFGQDASGEIYLVDHGGRVARIDPE